jgi:methylmalonyl-CoA/ethylmalonyl-CoA epimerase
VVNLTGHHAGIGVRDLDEATRWYGEVFGLETAASFSLPGFDNRIVLLSGGGFIIELIERPDTQASPTAGGDYAEQATVGGLHHVGFAVDDVDGTATELRERGARIVLEPTTLENLNLRLLHVLDNEGNLLEFVQPLA